MKRRGAREPAAGSTTVSSASDVVSQVAEPLEQPVIEVMRTVRALLKEGYSLKARLNQIQREELGLIEQAYDNHRADVHVLNVLR